MHCDYIGAKGVGLARLQTPAGAIDVYLSHLHADYSDDDDAKTDRREAETLNWDQGAVTDGLGRGWCGILRKPLSFS